MFYLQRSYILHETRRTCLRRQTRHTEAKFESYYLHQMYIFMLFRDGNIGQIWGWDVVLVLDSGVHTLVWAWAPPIRLDIKRVSGKNTPGLYIDCENTIGSLNTNQTLSCRKYQPFYIMWWQTCVAWTKNNVASSKCFSSPDNRHARSFLAVSKRIFFEFDWRG